MIKSKKLNILVLSLSLTTLSTGFAFAKGEGIEPGFSGEGTVKPPVVERRIEEIDRNAPDYPVSNSASFIISDEILEKQNQIDKYLFDEHLEEIRERGFTVTYTSPGENYIEIGITPYNEENAKYLYEIFGDDIKVVEGEQAILYGNTAYSTGIAEDMVLENAEVVALRDATSAETKPAFSKSSLLWGILGLITAGGITIIGMIRKKAKLS